MFLSFFSCCVSITLFDQQELLCSSSGIFTLYVPSAAFWFMAYFLFPLLCLWKSQGLVELAGHPRSSYPDSGHILKEQVFAKELCDPFVSSLVQSVASFPRFFFNVVCLQPGWPGTAPSPPWSRWGGSRVCRGGTGTPCLWGGVFV